MIVKKKYYLYIFVSDAEENVGVKWKESMNPEINYLKNKAGNTLVVKQIFSRVKITKIKHS